MPSAKSYSIELPYGDENLVHPVDIEVSPLDIMLPQGHPLREQIGEDRVITQAILENTGLKITGIQRQRIAVRDLMTQGHTLFVTFSTMEAGSSKQPPVCLRTASDKVYSVINPDGSIDRPGGSTVMAPSSVLLRKSKGSQRIASGYFLIGPK